MKRKASLALASFLLPIALEAQPFPPGQPASGPGGRDYPHGSVAQLRYGEGNFEYWIFEPRDPTPSSAPVVAFFHGWTAMDPGPYAGWIQHLARRGAIVIYPRYQESLATPADSFTSNALTALESAFKELSNPGHVTPRLDRVASLGHSVGGLIAANYAARAAALGLPLPRAVMSATPGKSWGWPEWTITPLEDLSTVAADTLLLSVACESDMLALQIDARRVYEETTQVPAENKDYVLMLTDTHGTPDLNADHYAPISPGRVGSGSSPQRGLRAPRTVRRGGAGPIPEGTSTADALDFYGLWKLFDALMDAAFTGANREYALGDTPQQRYMGVWSDGMPVRELQVTDQP